MKCSECGKEKEEDLKVVKLVIDENKVKTHIKELFHYDIREDRHYLSFFEISSEVFNEGIKSLDVLYKIIEHTEKQLEIIKQYTKKLEVYKAGKFKIKRNGYYEN